jgi:hypothetical protein
MPLLFVILDDYNGGLSKAFPNNFIKVSSIVLLSEENITQVDIYRNNIYFLWDKY